MLSKADLRHLISDALAQGDTRDGFRTRLRAAFRAAALSTPETERRPMATMAQNEAAGALQAVLNLYGGDAFDDILAAVRRAQAVAPSARAEALTEALMGVIRRRQGAALARFAGPFPSNDPIN